jgi:RIO kinase 2
MSIKAIAETFRTLEAPDFRVLSGLELAHGSYAHPPVEEIRKYANLPLDEVRFRLDLLDKKRLLGRARVDRIGYEGYFLTYAGYDCLALNALVKAGAVEALGKSLGVGKEADVYEGIRRKRRVTLKFHRLGRTSFRQTRRTRGFVANRSHTAWIYQSRLAAEREFQVLRLVHKCKVSVPRPIAHNRHLLVMGIIKGLELNDVGTIDAPEIVLDSVLLNIRRAYLDAHIIHGDLSEYNVMVKKDGRVLIIDWPQSINADHPNASDMLTRDIGNILRFFKRKFRVEYVPEQTLAYVKGESRQPGAAS